MGYQVVFRALRAGAANPSPAPFQALALPSPRSPAALRRATLRAWVTSCLVGIALGCGAAAQAAYPDHPLTIIVPFQAGGAGDAAARALAEGMSKELGQPVVVENRPGATGIIGTRDAAQAAPDGYTLLLAHSDTIVLDGLTHKRLPFDAAKDFVPVAFISRAPGVLIARRSCGIDSGASLIAAARARPGQVTLASWGVGSSPHLGLELMDQIAGIDLLHVPYQSTPEAVNAVLSAHVDLAWVTPQFALEAQRAGKASIVGASSSSRISRAPEIKTLSEQGFPGFDMDTWYGLMLPAGAPKLIQLKLHDLVNALLIDPTIVRKLGDAGHEIRAMSIPEFAAFVDSERRRWTEVIRSRGLEPQFQ